jgi:thioredoxin reductase
MSDELLENYDVVVIGGGAAGLNGALLLARSARSVVVIDSGAPRNAPADGVRGLLGHDGLPPAELLERGRSEVRRYGGHIVAGEVTSVTTNDDGSFIVSLAGGRRATGRRLLVTAGLVDELPDIPGLRERWGRDVLHCPYCHGWEVRDQRIGVLANGPRSLHQATLFRQLSTDVTYLTNTGGLSAGETEQLEALGITIVTDPLRALEVTDGRLSGLRFEDGSFVGFDALAVMPHMVARAGFLAPLGLQPVPHPSGIGEHIPVDATGRTSVPGVWAAGNVTDIAAQVGASAAAGALAAQHINADLVAENLDAAVTRLRAPGAVSEVKGCASEPRVDA